MLKASFQEVQKIKEKEIENTFMNLRRCSKLGHKEKLEFDGKNNDSKYYTIDLNQIAGVYQYYLEKLPPRLQILVELGVKVAIKLPLELTISTGKKLKSIAWDFPINTSKYIINNLVVSPAKLVLERIYNFNKK
jgi:hypothetical protein